MRAVLVVVWSLCLLSVVAAGAVCARFLGVHEPGLVELHAMVLAALLMVAGLTLAASVTGLVVALRWRALSGAAG